MVYSTPVGQISWVTANKVMNTKICNKCRQTKPKEEFGNDKTQRDGKDGYCKVCKKEQQLKFNQRHPLRHWAAVLKHRFGITQTQYKERYKKQRGVCVICGNINRNKTRLSVDHDHITGEIRGLLCSNCTHAIGCMHDNPVVLRRAADYLEGK